MNRILVFAIAATFFGCGEDDSSPKKAALRVTESGEPSTTTEQKELRPLYIAEGEPKPECTEADEGWLVYQNGFFVCQSAAWVVVDIRGPKGDTGEAGAKGEPGKDGEVIYVDGEYWQDPFTGVTWRVFGTLSKGIPTCNDGYRLPTVAEIDVASDNGMYVALGLDEPYDVAWTSTYHEDYGYYRYDFIAGKRLDVSGVPVSSSTDHPAGTYCIQEGVE